MSGKVLVYGGTGGIGLATARALVRRGHPVHLVARDAGRLDAAAAELGATTTRGDIADAELFARASAEAGEALRGMVYAIGTINLKPVGRLTTEDFLNDFRVNALGAALAVQAALPTLKGTPGASVVLFSSVAVAQGFAAHASVSMAKGAVEGLTRALAAELAPKVRVNAVAPSLTRTALARPLTASEPMAAAIAQLHPMQRLGEPEDVGALAAFLVSDDAAYITGQVMAVDGGRSTLRPKG